MDAKVLEWTEIAVGAPRAYFEEACEKRERGVTGERGGRRFCCILTWLFLYPLWPMYRQYLVLRVLDVVCCWTQGRLFFCFVLFFNSSDHSPRKCSYVRVCLVSRA